MTYPTSRACPFSSTCTQLQIAPDPDSERISILVLDIRLAQHQPRMPAWRRNLVRRPIKFTRPPPAPCIPSFLFASIGGSPTSVISSAATPANMLRGANTRDVRCSARHLTSSI
ncbi:hypothetical protein BJV77DRAFT_317353 [Russula vinacea]|nr:hypothetical protein BJV77DRAFT_317353 [Russula vinacea]